VKEFVVYTLARVGLFAASFVIILGIWAAVTGSLAVLWAVVLAAVVSAVASYYLLRGPREKFAARVEDRAARMTRKIEEARAKEDVD
jgi:mannitol-specific phosphotransferase system IIBC component